MSRRRALLWSVGIVVALVAVALAVQALLARQAAEALRGDVSSIRSSLSAGDLAAARDHLVDAQAQASRLDLATTGPQWALAERVPGLGEQVAAARTVSAAVDALAPSALALLDWAVPLQASGGRTADGSIDLSALESAQPLLGDAAQAARAAAAALEGADSSSLDDIEQAREQLDRGARLLDRAAEASAYLPALLGADGPRTYAVLLQNVAEIRGSGGLVGAYALITVDGGRISLDEAAARKAGLDGSPIPYEDVADEGQLGTWGADLAAWPDYNLSLDFPLTARLTAAGMAERGTPIDGVVALDARVVAALLAGTGPIEEQGARLTRDNAEDFFTRDIYAKVPDVQAKDALTVSLLQAVLERSLTGALDLPALATALVDPVSEGRLRMWVDDGPVEEWLLTTPLGGQLPDEPGPFVGIALNNAAGSKLDAYLGLSARYRYAACETEPEGESTLEILLANGAPSGLPDYVDIRLDRPAAPPGSTSLLVHVYGPEGSTVTRARLDGKGASFTSTSEGGHPVWGFYVELDRGQESTLRLTFDEPVVAGVDPRLILPPLQEEPRGKVTPRPCAPSR